jgi:hypothetical protein
MEVASESSRPGIGMIAPDFSSSFGIGAYISLYQKMGQGPLPRKSSRRTAENASSTVEAVTPTAAVICFAKARPIAVSGSPRCLRSHNSVVSAVLKPRLIPCPIAIHSIFPFKDKVLRPPIESAVKLHYSATAFLGKNSVSKLVRKVCALDKETTRLPAAKA